MIAQVITSTAPIPFTDETRTYIQELVSRARQADGCESVIHLVDPTTGEGITINLFRDEQRLDSFIDLSKTLAGQAEQKLDASVNSPRVYEVVAQA